MRLWWSLVLILLIWDELICACFSWSERFFLYVENNQSIDWSILEKKNNFVNKKKNAKCKKMIMFVLWLINNDAKCLMCTANEIKVLFWHHHQGSFTTIIIKREVFTFLIFVIPSLFLKVIYIVQLEGNRVFDNYG